MIIRALLTNRGPLKRQGPLHIRGPLMGLFKLGPLEFQHIFHFFFVNLSPSQKIVGQIRELYSFG